MIPHNRPSLGIEEEMAALKVLKSGWIAQGSEVEKFEDEFCEFLGIQKGLAVAVSSGTAALYLALWALNAQGKHVAYPSYTCSALRNATAMAGGKEVLVDSQPHSPNMDVSKITSQTDIAIIPHMYGIPQEISKHQNRIKIIEDCAQSLGASFNKVPAGLQGDIGIFSFYATKLMTSGGQGGMVISKNTEMIEKIKDYRLFDKRKDDKIRFNFQMTDLQAAIGRAQLQKLPQFLKRREEIYQFYKNSGFPLLDSNKETTPVRHRAILVSDQQENIINELQEEKVTSVVPLKNWELLATKEKCPIAYDWTQKTVSLPIYPELKDEEVKRISAALARVKSF